MKHKQIIVDSNDLRNIHLLKHTLMHINHQHNTIDD